MVVLSYPGERYEVFLQTMSSLCGTLPDNEKFLFPEPLGSGFFRLINLPMDIQLMLFDFVLHDDVQLVRRKGDNEYYNLRIELLEESDPTQISINDLPLHNNAVQSYIYLNNAGYPLSYKTFKGMKARGISLRLSKQTIQAVTGLSDDSSLLLNSVTNSTDQDRIIPATGQMIQLVSECFEIQGHDPGKTLKYFNRSLLLAEYFFNAIAYSIYNERFNITAEDFKKVREVEKLLTANLDQLPPKQEALSGIANMSVSKLKYIFKAVYGMSMYKYYQKMRMEKALQLLQDGNTIRETAYELGFKDMANFSRNFKQEFNIQPGKIRHLTPIL